MFLVLYIVRDNKGNERHHIDQMDEDKYKKVTLHYHLAAIKDLGRPRKNWQQSCKVLDGLSHDRNEESIDNPNDSYINQQFSMN